MELQTENGEKLKTKPIAAQKVAYGNMRTRGCRNRQNVLTLTLIMAAL